MRASLDPGPDPTRPFDDPEVSGKANESPVALFTGIKKRIDGTLES
jgi:hypothetical protein